MLKKTQLPQSFKSYLCSENITRTCITENKQHVILPYFQFYISLQQVHSSLAVSVGTARNRFSFAFHGRTGLLTSSRKFLAWRWNFIYFWINCCCHHWLAYSKVPCLYFAQMRLAGVSQEQHWKLFALASLVSSNSILMAETVTETILFFWPKVTKQRHSVHGNTNSQVCSFVWQDYIMKGWLGKKQMTMCH